MEERGRVAIGTVAMRNKQYLTAIRPLDGRAGDVDHALRRRGRTAQGDRRVAVAPIKPAPKELRMALQLLDSLASDWNPKQYKDTYVEELRDRIEAKEAGEEIVADEIEERRADVIDLSEALQRSLDEARATKRRKTTRRKTRKSA